jgi:uncharacterized membrane protein YqjE
MKPDSLVHSRTTTFSHVVGFLAAISEYFSARLRLVGIEAKEAGIEYGIGIGMVAAGAFTAVLGYVFLIITVVFAIAAAFNGEHAWIWVMGGAAILHLAGAAALGLFAKRRFQAGAFSQTIEEFKKDQAWLHHLGKNH